MTRTSSPFRVISQTAAAACVGVVMSLSAPPLLAQPAALVYRLGKDTVAIEQYTRTATSLQGDMVQRNGAAVTRLQYQVSLGKDGTPTAATVKRLQPDGTPAATGARETRFQFTADSVVREVVFADSVQRRAFKAQKALLVSPTFVYGLTELAAMVRKSGKSADSIPSIGMTGGLGYVGLTAVGGDTVRLRGGPYAMVLRFDATSKLLSVDGTFTTNKSIATRSAGGLDMTAIAKAMKPTGTLSTRDVARGAFGQGGMVLVDYGRPSVRERSVWGGTLVPFDSVWRAGANDATHLFTTRELVAGGTTVPPGMYSLFVQHTRNGTFLIVNKQTGQWGTVYNPALDVVRIPMTLTDVSQFVEELTVTVRALGGPNGAIEFAWGPKVASAKFVAQVPR